MNKTTNVSEILESYHENSNVFSVDFTEMFIDDYGNFNHKEFNRYFDTSASFSTINNALVELTGSKILTKRKFETPYKNQALFESVYEFGKFPHARDWIMHMSEAYGALVSKSYVLGYIAKQHPKRVSGSFLPTAFNEDKHVDKSKEPEHE